MTEVLSQPVTIDQIMSPLSAKTAGDLVTWSAEDDLAYQAAADADYASSGQMTDPAEVNYQAAKDETDGGHIGNGDMTFAVGSLIVDVYLQPFSSPRHAENRQPLESDGANALTEGMSKGRSHAVGWNKLKRLAATVVSASALFGSSPIQASSAPQPSGIEVVTAGRPVPAGTTSENIDGGTLRTKNWAGKIFSGDGAFSGVGANITVPKDIDCAKSEKLSEWVGILGTEAYMPIGQAGFQADCVKLGSLSGLAGISIIAEAFPGPVKELGSVQEGDVLHVFVTYADGQYSMRITVNSSEKTYTAKLRLPKGDTSDMTEAGIIMERAQQGKQNYPFAPFSPPSLVSLIVHGRSGWRFPNGLRVANVYMTNDYGRVNVVEPTALKDHGAWTNEYVK